MMMIKKYKYHWVAIGIGAIAGYAYYHFIGCSGSCMIASNPWISTIYGGIMGGLFVNAFMGRKQNEVESGQ